MGSRLQKVLVIAESDDTWVSMEKWFGKKPGRNLYALQRIRSFEAALKLADIQSFDAILLDTGPLMEACTDFLFRLRNEKAPPPVLVLMDDSDDRWEEKMIRAGAVDCLIKSRLNSALVERAVRLGALKKQAAVNRHAESDRRCKMLFAESPAPAWEQDFSSVKGFIDHLKRKGVLDFEKHFDLHPGDVLECLDRIRTVDMNRSALNAFGAATVEEIQACNDLTVGGESLEPFKALLCHIGSGAVCRFEYDAVLGRLNGDSFHASIRWVAAPGQEVGLGSVLVFMTDLTDRNRAGNDLAEVLQELEVRDHEICALSQGARAALSRRSLADALCRIADHCREATHCGGSYWQLDDAWQREHGLGISQAQEEDMEGVGCALRKVWRARPPALFFENHPCAEKYGELVGDHASLVNFMFVPLSAGGKIAGYLALVNKPGGFSQNDVGICSAFTALASITLENELAFRSLDQSEKRFQQLLDNIHVAFWIESPDGKELFYVNNTYERIYGRSCRSLYENPESWQDHVHPDDLLDLNETRNQYLRGTFRVHEYRVLHADGTFRWVRVRPFPILDAGGSICRVAGISEDVTEEKRLRKEAELNLERVFHRDKLAALGEVVAGVAHEINNPNSFITYNVPLLEETWQIFEPLILEYGQSHPEWRKGKLTLRDYCEDMRGIIDAVKTGSDRINGVVTSLKDFARVEEAALARPVHVNEVVSRTMTIIGGQLRKQTSRVEVRLGENLPMIEGHFQKLEQVLANLLLNAAHAIKSRQTGVIVVSTRYIQRHHCVLIEVEDNGEGMPQESVHRIFDPFYTTRRSSGGTGLGLSISNTLIQEHKGVIGVLSRPGIGSRFTVFLPLNGSSPLELRPTILCVDDDSRFLNMVKSLFLRVARTPVETMDNPEDVVAFLEEYPEIDMVFCDVRMPQVDGWTLLERIKTRFPLLPVIMCSGFLNDMGGGEAKFGLADRLLAKPFGMSQLSTLLKEIGRQKL